MKRFVALWLITPALTGLLAFQAGGYIFRSGPRADVTDTIDLGVRPYGDHALAQLTVRNPGRQPLDLTDIRPCCGTTVTLWGDQGADDRPLTRATVPPGGELQLAARVIIRGAPGRLSPGSIECRTNDPNRPTVRIDIRAAVGGFLVASPSAVEIPALPQTGVAERSIEIRDTGLTERRAVTRIESSDPTWLQVRSVRREDRPYGPANRQLGHVVATANILVVVPERPGTLQGELRVFTDDSATPAVTVPIRAKRLARVEVVPSTVVLPRIVNGSDCYNMKCLCRSTDGRPFVLTAEGVLTGLAVRVHESSAKGRNVHVVSIEWRPDSDPSRDKSVSRSVTLNAQFEDGAEALTIPVVCYRPE
jgi:hypothetical protein